MRLSFGGRRQTVFYLLFSCASSWVLCGKTAAMLEMGDIMNITNQTKGQTCLSEETSSEQIISLYYICKYYIKDT